MTRFDATEPAARRKLFVDAITAHRERGSGFLTIEVDPDALPDESSEAASDTATEADAGPDPDLGTPWLQFGDGTINLDCTDAELERLTSLLEEFPAFTITDITRPDEAEGANVRVSAKADANRIAQCLDAILQQVYALPSSVTVWVVEI